MITIVSIKTLFPLSLDDAAISAHLNRATKDYADVTFEDDQQELEVVGSKTIYYLAPLLWLDVQNRAEEYSESLGSFNDITSFQKLWLDRAESALTKVNDEDKDSIVWDVI